MEAVSKGQKIARIILILLIFLIAILSIVIMLRIFDFIVGIRYTTGDIDDIANAIVTEEDEANVEIAKSITVETQQEAASASAPAPDDSESAEPAEVQTVANPAVQTVTWDSSTSILEGAQQHIDRVPVTMKAWLNVDGLDINDPVMQYTDNDFYLTHNELGEKSVWGCYYFSCNNATSTLTNLDRFTIIFGHSNGNSAHYKFSMLKRFKDRDFASKHQKIHLTINGSTKDYQIFSVCDFPVNNDKMNILNVSPSDELFKNEVLTMKALSYNKYNVDVQYDDKILVLCTCTGNHEYDTRFLVCAREVR